MSRFCSRGTRERLKDGPTRRIALVEELAADLAERGIMDRPGMHPARQCLYVQVLDGYQIEFAHQAGGEPVPFLRLARQRCCWRR